MSTELPSWRWLVVTLLVLLAGMYWGPKILTGVVNYWS